jgi:plastocyanin
VKPLVTLISLGILMAVSLAGSHAELHQVAIESSGFNPSDVSIIMGDSVQWTNYDGVERSSTSDAGYWDSGAIEPGGYYIYTFNLDIGDYPYHCSFFPNQTGVIRVVVRQDVQPVSIGQIKALLKF